MMTDPIADFLSRIRNAALSKKKTVVITCSAIKKRIAEILEEAGYIDGFQIENSGAAKFLKIFLRYDSAGVSVIDGLKRVSRPGLRNYAPVSNLPVVRNGLGLSVISTSKGVITGEQAKQSNIGGEVICLVW